MLTRPLRRYTVAEGHTDRAADALPLSMTIKDSAGNEASAYTSLTGGAASIDANTPSVTAATVSPDATNLVAGDTVTVSLTAADAEPGLLEGSQTQLVNGRTVSGSFSELGSGVYTFRYSTVRCVPCLTHARSFSLISQRQLRHRG